MKKLVVSLIGIVLVAILSGGCGVGEEDDFFEKYYSECVQLCETCAEWAKMCGNSEYDVNVCVDFRWFMGHSNQGCSTSIPLVIEEWISPKLCNPIESKHRCLLDTL